MKILVLNWRDTKHPFHGGAEVVTMEHAKRWVESGNSVTWFTSIYPGAKKTDIVNGVHIIRQGGALFVYVSAMSYVFFHSQEYDVIVDQIHGFSFFSPLFTKKPVVVFIHEIAGEIWDYMYPFPINAIGKFIEKHYFAVYKKCLFWTDARSTVPELVDRGIPEGNCIPIPCPIVTPDKMQYKGLKESVPTYIFVSRVVKMKGVEDVIKAFSFILKEQPSAQLWIVGGGESSYIHSLKNMIETYNLGKHVFFWGSVREEEKFRLMSRAHLLLHASVKEGWGLVVLEAAYVGTPSVVYNVPGLCDVVKNGTTGVVLSESSPIDMAREAVMLYTDKKRYAGFQKFGRQWVESLKWPETAEQSLHILKKAVYGNRTV